MRPVETEHLLLRPFTLDDAQAYWPLVSHPEVLRYTGEHPVASLEDVREMLASRPLRDYVVYGYGRMACIEKSSGLLVGFSGLKYLEDLREVDIGYRFLPECWGKGYATESARALIDDGNRKHGIHRIIGLVMPDNAASARVLIKLGLTFERQMRLPSEGISVDVYATGVAQAWTSPATPNGLTSTVR